MELTYLVRGADDKDYGPVSLQQLSSWVNERRLSAQQQVRRSDMEHWAPASSFTELQPLFGFQPETQPPPMGASSPPLRAEGHAQPLAQVHSAATWFYWIAGLSLVNSIAAFSGSSWRFILGLGIPEVLRQMFAGASGSEAVALALSVLVAGVFILFGFFAYRAQVWAFVAGMVLFAADGVIFLIGSRWIGVAFHALVLYWLFRGLMACRSLPPNRTGSA
jgi:hypothetical protein